MSRFGRTLAGLVCAAMAFIAPAFAATKSIKIVEIYAGSSAKPKSQYIVLQVYADGPSYLSGQRVTVFDSFGSVAGKYTFTSNVPKDGPGNVLLATAEAEKQFKVKADLAMEPVITPAGGKICLENLDCVSWGRFASSATMPSPSGTPFNKASGGIPLGHAIRRDVSGGSVPELDDADDTQDSAADFDCAATATPKNNSGTAGSYTDPSACPAA